MIFAMLLIVALAIIWNVMDGRELGRIRGAVVLVE